jgi:2-keto-4-pentenoate hydratase/2-oxohepta-3-ene-1,7-dioic acid hydratase in catechol pathway
VPGAWPDEVIAIGAGRRRVLRRRRGVAGTAHPLLKPSTAVNNPEDSIIFPPELDYLIHEGEIRVAIGRSGE